MFRFVQLQCLLCACGLAMLAWATPASAARPAAMPPDTLPGETRLVRLLAQGICEQLSLESRHQDLAVLTRSQGMGLVQDILTAAIARDSSAFYAFLAHAPDTAAAVQRVTLQAMLDLTTRCPVGSGLLMQMGVNMAGLDTNLSAGQQRALETVAQDLCDRLALADAQLAFGRRTAPERMDAFWEAQQQALVVHGQALVDAFGQQLLASQESEGRVWQNVDRLMYDRCPVFTGQLRVDRGLARLRAASASGSAPPPLAPAKPAARTARRK